MCTSLILAFRVVLLQLKSKLTELEILKSEKMEQFIMATRKELELYWDHCYYSEQQRNKFKPQFSTEYSEAVLAAHEEEVDHIRAYYETNIELFKKVAQRQQLWEKRLELEAKEKNSKRLLKANFKDLENERKDRIRVSKRVSKFCSKDRFFRFFIRFFSLQLPIVEEELREAMQHYLDVNGAPFLVGGVPYEQFLEEQICSHTAELEHEREAKKQTKKAHLIHETMYGSRPVTPANRTIAQKRKAEATESLSSTKRYKAGEVNQTAANSMKSPFVPKRTPVKSSRVSGNCAFCLDLRLNLECVNFFSVRNSTDLRPKDPWRQERLHHHWQ